MAKEVEVRCRCGEVVGMVANASPQKVNRVVCYCDDCQAFLHQLGRADLLNAQGGTDIIQVAPASLTFIKGQDRITGVRLTPKGLFRWYATCCNTPVGNTLGPAIPFVGIVAQTFDGGVQRAQSVFGTPTGAILTRYALGPVPAGSTGISLTLLLRAITKVLGWRLRGRGWPNPFFHLKTREAIYPLRVLSSEERDELRPLCGPHPAAKPISAAP
jgi:Family of unknown function (DUF6151)